MWPIIINGIGIFYMLNVCEFVLSRYPTPVVEKLIILSGNMLPCLPQINKGDGLWILCKEHTS